MKRAIELAKMGAGKVNPNPMVGAVIVKGGKIIGEGYHEFFGSDHAEVVAFKNAEESCEGGDLYVNLEPCSHYGKTPPCIETIIRNKIKKVYVGILDPNTLISGKGVQGLRENGIDVQVGLLEDECRELNEVFINYIKYKKPFVVSKYAMTLDGFIATKDYESKWITNEKSRKEVALMRNNYMGLLVGINTVLKDNPRLTARIKDGINPYKIILDSKLRVDLDLNIFQFEPEKTMIFTTKARDFNKQKEIEKLGSHVYIVEDQDGVVDIKEVIKVLGELGIDSVMIEGGSHINFSGFNENVIDKVIVFIAPKIIGGEKSISPVSGEGVSRLEDCFSLDFHCIKSIGGDLLLEGYVRK